MVLHADAFEDNYIWMLTFKDGSASPRPVLIVDPGDESPVLAMIEQHNLDPVAVLCTHHHYDHVGGAAALAEHYSIPVYGPGEENISAVTHSVSDGDRLSFPQLGVELSVLAVPGHTLGHIAYYTEGLLFCGDTLFSGGCGRLFEGTPAQMLNSLERLASLPGETAVYCAHEYTEANMRFASTVEPANAEIAQHINKIRELRKKGEPSLPSSIARERLINPFLHSDQLSVQQSVSAHTGRPVNDSLATFTELRRWKDGFRG